MSPKRMVRVVYCKTEWEVPLEPSPEAVLSQREVGEVSVAPGSNLGQVVDAIKQREAVPRGSLFSFLADYPAWCIISQAERSIQVKHDAVYYFRIRLRPSKRKRCEEDVREFEVLSKNFATFQAGLQLDQIEDAFLLYWSKSTTHSLSEEMLSSLNQLHSASDMLKSCEDFEARYKVPVVADEAAFRELAANEGSVVSGLVLQGNSSSLCFISVTAKYPKLIFSKPLSLRQRQLRELAFLHWLGCIVALRRSVDPDKLPWALKLVNSRKDLDVCATRTIPGRSVSNAVLNVVPKGSEVQHILKIGHSAQALQTVEDLCLDTGVWKQVENESKILKKLGKFRNCRSVVPPLVFSGYWIDRPAVLTKLQGVPFLEVFPQRPVEAAVAEKLCKDLTKTVLILHEHGIIHGDINPANVGMYSSEAAHRFYLYDYGCASEIRKPRGQVSGNLLFSSLATFSSLMTELVSVVYTCLYLAGVALPWEVAADDGDLEQCRDLRQQLHEKRLCLDMSGFSSGFVDWCRFVLEHSTDAADAMVFQKARSLLGEAFY